MMAMLRRPSVVRFSPLKPLGQSRSILRKVGGGEKVYINGPGHMTKMAAHGIEKY